MQRKKRQLSMFCAIFLMVLLTGTGMLVLADETGTIDPPITQEDPEEPSTGEPSENVPIETPAIRTEEPVQTPTPDNSSTSTSEPTPSSNTEPTPTPYEEPEITPTPYVPQNTPTPYVQQNNDDDDNDTAGTTNTQGTASPTPSPSPQAGTIERPKVTLSPSEESTSETKESNYVEFARVDIKQNAIASNMFYGGVALIVLGVAGLVVLIVLFIKNRARNANEGIFEEIEEAEIRGYYPETVPDYEDVDADAVYNDDPYAQYADTGDVIMPESSSIYTGEFEPISSYDNDMQYDNDINEDHLPLEPYEDSELPPAYEPEPPSDPNPVPTPPKQPDKPGYTTEEILREVLNAEKDGHVY